VEIIYEGSAVPDFPDGTAVTIGSFDGVHLGHQTLISETARIGREHGLPSVAVTFDRHPMSVVDPDNAPRLLTSLAQRLEYIGDAGVDYVYVVRFDELRSLEGPEQFVREVFADLLGAKFVIVGHELHFGHQRRGQALLLAQLSVELGFTAIALPPAEVPGLGHEILHESTVREALARDDMELTAELLGRTYEVRGVVEHGDKRGRTIGFPTANVAVPGDIMMPGDGVFAGWYVRPDGSTHMTAISLGRRPTFYAEHGIRLLEAYLLDFDGDLYGELAKVRIAKWIRAQVRFPSVDKLVAQLERDVEATRTALA
jgi:riboflavin kinase/FMN adenylyltransferase